MISYFTTIGGKTIQWRKDSLFKKWCWENWTATCKRIKQEYYLIPYTKINSKWIKDLNVRPETMKLLEEDISSTLIAISLTIFFVYVSSGKEKQSKNKQMGLHQPKSFWTAKETINKMKRTSTEWEKISVKDISNKWLLSKLYKELIQLNIQKEKDKYHMISLTCEI